MASLEIYCVCILLDCFTRNNYTFNLKVTPFVCDTSVLVEPEQTVGREIENHCC